VPAAKQWSTLRCLRDAPRLRWLQTTLGHLAISGFRHDGASPTEPSRPTCRPCGQADDVLLRTYAKCLAGQGELATRRIAGALRED
jgi:hypothetical protein